MKINKFKKIREFIKKIAPSGSVMWRFLMFLYQIGYITNSQKRFGSADITEINLEFVSYCNLRCKWCSLDHSKKKIVMDEELLKKFLNNLIFDRRFKKIKKLNIWNGGEVLLHPNIGGMLKIIKDYKAIAQKKNLYFPEILLLTNAMLLNKNLSKEIIDLDILDSIRFSIDGGSIEAFEEIRIGAKWDMVYKNISNFVEINNGKIKTNIICIIGYDKEHNINWMEDKFKSLLNLVDTYELRYPHTWEGTQIFDITDKHKQMKHIRPFCYFLIHSLVILPNGDVTVCCVDLNSKGVIGNLYRQDLFSIYSCKQRRKMNWLYLTGRKSEISLCKDCMGH